jgi:hypothetical protein
MGLNTFLLLPNFLIFLPAFLNSPYIFCALLKLMSHNLLPLVSLKNFVLNCNFLNSGPVLIVPLILLMEWVFLSTCPFLNIYIKLNTGKVKSSIYISNCQALIFVLLIDIAHPNLLFTLLILVSFLCNLLPFYYIITTFIFILFS